MLREIHKTLMHFNIENPLNSYKKRKRKGRQREGEGVSIYIHSYRRIIVRYMYNG